MNDIWSRAMIAKAVSVFLTAGLAAGASGQEPEIVTDTIFNSFEATGQLTLHPEMLAGVAVQWSQVRGTVEWPTVSLAALFTGSLVPLPILELGGNAKLVGNGYIGGGGALMVGGGPGTLFSPTGRVGVLGAKGARLEVVWQPLFGQLVMVRLGLGRF